MPGESEVMRMLFIEELASTVCRIKNMRERIECSNEPDMCLEEQAELRYLLEKLERMKQRQGCRIARIRVSIINNLQKGEENNVYTCQF